MDWTQQARLNKLLFMESNPAAWLAWESAYMPIKGANFQSNLTLLIYLWV